MTRTGNMEAPLFATLLATLLAIALAACSTAATAAPTTAIGPTGSPGAAPPGSSAAACPTSQPASLAAGDTRTVTLDTPKGTIVIKIDGSLAPVATGNFVALAACGFYNGVVFHRLVPGFVIQGGDGQYGRQPHVDDQLVGTGGPGYTIADDPVTSPYGRGTVAMARTADPHSEGSQFFIVLDDAARAALEQANTYAIIGKVTSGMEVVDAIAAMPNGGPPANPALAPVAMTKVTVSNP